MTQEELRKNVFEALEIKFLSYAQRVDLIEELCLTYARQERDKALEWAVQTFNSQSHLSYVPKAILSGKTHKDLEI